MLEFVACHGSGVQREVFKHRYGTTRFLKKNFVHYVEEMCSQEHWVRKLFLSRDNSACQGGGTQ